MPLRRPSALAALKRWSRMMHVQGRWHRIVSALPPRMAPADSLERKSGTDQGSMGFKCLNGIGRTGRRESAMAERTEQHCLGWRENSSIKPDAGDEDGLNRLQSSFLRRLACRRRVSMSRSTADRFFPTMDERAIKTMSTGCRRPCWCSRNASRKSLRVLLRMVALPIFRLVMTPSRAGEPAPRGNQFTIKHPLTNRLPS